jgi:ketosteroid isomerase-like protein
MKKLTQIFFAMFVLLLLTGSSFAQQWSDAQKDVWAGVEKYWQVSSSGDAAGFMNYFDDSYMGWSNQSRVPMNKANTGKWVTQDAKNNTTLVYSITPLSVWVKGDFAYVHYTYAMIEQNKESNKKTSSAGIWTDILMKKDGKWMLIGDHGGRTSGGSSNSDD